MVSGFLDIVLMGWIIGQFRLWSSPLALQYLYLVLGFVIALISFAAPCVKKDRLMTIQEIAT